MTQIVTSEELAASRRAWERETMRQYRALGVPFTDAARAIAWALRLAPPDADMREWMPTPAQLDAEAQITDADIADARADWLAREDIPAEYRLLLDAIEQPVGVGEARGEDAAYHRALVEAAVRKVARELEEGGPESGNRGHAGVKGSVGGSAPGGGAATPQVRLTRHAFERTAERHKFGPVKRAMRALEGKATPQGQWYAEMRRGDALDGYLVGEDGVVKTVLGGWYNRANLRGEQVLLEAVMTEAASQLSVIKSIKYHLALLTPNEAWLFCDEAGIERMTPAELGEWWRDWTWDGLLQLMWARGEVKTAESET